MNDGRLISCNERLISFTDLLEIDVTSSLVLHNSEESSSDSVLAGIFPIHLA